MWAGQYVCSEARVAGKAVPCTAPPLSLKSYGKFELQGREGEYLVSGKLGGTERDGPEVAREKGSRQ